MSNDANKDIFYRELIRQVRRFFKTNDDSELDLELLYKLGEQAHIPPDMVKDILTNELDVYPTRFDSSQA